MIAMLEQKSSFLQYLGVISTAFWPEKTCFSCLAISTVRVGAQS